MKSVLAQRIYQDTLDAVSVAIMSGDLLEMMQHTAIPYLMATRDSQIVMASPEELDMVMEDLRLQLLSHGVTRFTRTCLRAHFITGHDDMIAGCHMTDGRDAFGSLFKPYQSHAVLIQMEEGWKWMWVQADLNNSDLGILSPDIAAAQAKAYSSLEAQCR